MRHCPLHGLYSDHKTDDDLAEYKTPRVGSFRYTPADVEALRRQRMSELDRVRYDLGFDPLR